VYLLLATQKVFFGPIRHSENAKLHDLSVREGFILAPLVLCAILIGIYPQPFLDSINPTVTSYARQFRARAGLPALASAVPRAKSPRSQRIQQRPRRHPAGLDMEQLQGRSKAKLNRAKMFRIKPGVGVVKPPKGGEK